MRFAAIVLAAGAGSRFGGGKLTALYRGRPLITYALDAANAAPVEEIVIVLGAERDIVADQVATSPVGPPRRVAYAENWSDGLSASLRTGAEALSPSLDGAFVLLGDMPAIPHPIFEMLAAAFQMGAVAAAPTYGDRRGHPVLLGRKVLDLLRSLKGDQGARSLLKHAALVPTYQPGILFDIDEPKDLLR